MTDQNGSAPILCLVDPNLTNFVGHHFEYDRAVFEGAKAEGYEVHVLAHKQVSAAIENMLPLHRAFTFDIWGDPAGSSDKATAEIAANDQFCDELLLATKGLSFDRRSIVFGHMITAKQLLGWARFAEHQRGPDGPAIVLLLRYQPEFYMGPNARLAFTILEGLASEGRVRLSSDSSRLSQQLERLTTLPVEVWPIPHTTELSHAPEPPKSKTGPLRVVSLGNARDEKGILELTNTVRIIQAMGEDHRFEFFFQVNDAAEDVKLAIVQFALEGHPSAKLMWESLSSSEYFDLLKSADIVALPYWREIYAARTSGVFLEAVAAGKPVLCTEDTWMSDQLMLAGAGVSVKDRNDSALAAALLRIADDYAALSHESWRTAGEWLKIHNPASFMRALLHGEQAPTAMSSRPTAAILYPWGDAPQNAAGAALRVNLLARFAAERCSQVRLLGDGDYPEVVRDGVTFESFAITQLIERTKSYLWISRFARHILRAKNGEEIYLLYLLLPQFSRSFYGRINEVVRNSDFVFLEYPFWAPLVERACRANGKSYVLTAHDVICDQVRQSRPLRWLTALVERWEMGLGQERLAVTEADQARFAAWRLPARISLNSVDVETSSRRLPVNTRSLLLSLCGLDADTGPIFLFVGSKFGPNITAAKVARTVARDLHYRRPDLKAQVIVAGACLEPQTELGFTALGRIADLTLKLLYEHCSSVIVPLQQGTGMSIKSIEALAGGHVIIGTKAAFRGLPNADEQIWICENDFKSFPDHMIRLVEDQAFKGALVRRIQAYAHQLDFRTTFAVYLDIFPDLKSVEPRKLKPDDQYQAYVIAAATAARQAGMDDLALSLAIALLEQFPDCDAAALHAAEILSISAPDRALPLLKSALRGGADAVAVLRAKANALPTAEAEPLLKAAAQIAVGRCWTVAGELNLRSSLWSDFHAGERRWVALVATMVDELRPNLPASDYTYLRVHAASDSENGVDDRTLDRAAVALEKGFDAYWGAMLQARLLYRRGRLTEGFAAFASASRATPDHAAADAVEHEALQPFQSEFSDLTSATRLRTEWRGLLDIWPENARLNLLIAESMKQFGEDLLIASQHFHLAARNPVIACKAHLGRAELLKWIGEPEAADAEINEALARAYDDEERRLIQRKADNPAYITLQAS